MCIYYFGEYLLPELGIEGSTGRTKFLPLLCYKPEKNKSLVQHRQKLHLENSLNYSRPSIIWLCATPVIRRLLTVVFRGRNCVFLCDFIDDIPIQVIQNVH